ncbi:phenylalanyl-tRNA synthetase subunit beta [Ignicoccus islandicus DSM 13165]|uniref:phenylalanine--tRNA ligase n=1 Tax=Ignicoccus islandicus DSM 13165 TaxID=940295 RepID=A0A0U3F747_9CREN|nr:phenylalanine--tRNA ligase subunit beta [Ignicoccus islandicus]ALU11465.1 phenylalanyl-tRNA synthetase subunit beta [Ignicoccus islandicus DSM 13165]
MPVVRVDVNDLSRIAKTDLDAERVSQILPVLKGEVEKVEGDEIEYEASHDRADLFSAEGLGRAIGIFLGSRGNPKYKVVDSEYVLDLSKAPSYRPYAMLAIVRNLELDNEAIRQVFQLQEKLAISYGVHRKLVSVGLYDLKYIKGKVIRYQTLPQGKYVPLDYEVEMTFEEVLEKTEKGRTYGHLIKKGEYPVLADEENVLSLVPILNANYNKVTENTRDVLIDVTGTEPYLMARVLDVMVTSLIERSNDPVIERVKAVRGNEVLFETPELPIKEIELTMKTVREFVEVNIDLEKAKDLLNKMGLEAKVVEGKVKVSVPPYRIDVHGEVDLIEDLISAYGYNELETLRDSVVDYGELTPMTKLVRFVSDKLVSLGLVEVFNFSLTSSELLELLGENNFVKIVNPRMKSYDSVRTSLVPSLLLTALENQKSHSKFKAFEVGDVLVNEGYTRREKRLGILLYGDFTLTDAISHLNALFEELGLKAKYVEREIPYFIPERSAKVVIGNIEVGSVGEVNPQILVSLGVKAPVTIAEISLDKILELF